MSAVANKLLTLVLLVEDGTRVLLGLKKRGFGVGKWNGFGGKVEAGETIPAAAMRELQEEAGITALDLVKRGCVAFTFEDSPVPMEVHVFKATKYSGVITESEEMRPQWFPVTEVPFASMWKDDEIWFPYLLADQCFTGRCHFKDSFTMLEHAIRVVAPEELP